MLFNNFGIFMPEIHLKEQQSIFHFMCTGNIYPMKGMKSTSLQNFLFTSLNSLLPPLIRAADQTHQIYI